MLTGIHILFLLHIIKIKVIKITNELNKLEKFCAIFAICFGIIFICGLIGLTVIAVIDNDNIVNNCQKYCQEKGYDGYFQGNFKNYQSCYKTVPHESGVGIKIVYSGYVKYGDCK